MSASCGFCQPKQRIKQCCPRHQNTPLSHFCANHSCLEMLCTNCLKQHQENHQQMHTPERICSLIDIEQYYDKITEKELKYESQRKDKERAKGAEKRVDPCQILCEFVDEYFYGSTENKIENLKARKESLEKANTKTFIDIVERSSHYKIDEHFKQKYFNFLDSLIGKTIQ